MKHLIILSLILSSCTLFKKQDDNELQSIVKEVIQEKGSPGIRIEVMRLQTETK